ncbi:MAG: SpoIIE family protein phosphatase [Cyanobacteria bacterium SID2]|nr:SpoIIE family protein phosphatase [Cyanobacteria bacterium SID2]MBP0002641.1 SpoIIE family protein phosphatase [Cyanobacteria bacterium SBC]
MLKKFYRYLLQNNFNKLSKRDVRASSPWRQYLPLAIVLGVGLTASVAGAKFVRQWERDRSRELFARQADAVTFALQQQIDRATQLVGALNAFYRISEEFTGQRFAQFSQQLLVGYPNSFHLGWAQWSENDAASNACFAEISPSQAEREQLAIVAIEPSEASTAWLGCDLAPLLDSGKTRLLQQLSIEPSVTLPNGEVGFLFYQPLNARDFASGVVFALYPQSDFFRTALTRLNLRTLDVYLYDLSVDRLDSQLQKASLDSREGFLMGYAAKEHQLFDRVSNPPPPRKPLESYWNPRRPQTEKEEGYPLPRSCPYSSDRTVCMRSFNVADREWTLLIVPNSPLNRVPWASLATFAIGSLGTSVLAVYLWMSIRRTLQTEALAKELRKANTAYRVSEARTCDRAKRLEQTLQQLHHTQAENLRLEAELDVTHRLQQMLLPKAQDLQAVTELEIADYMEPAAEIGGDYYDVLCGKEQVKIGIGDVTGHGLESGVLMLMVQTAVRTLLEANETDPRVFLETLNRTIYGNVQRMNSDLNLTLALLDYRNGRLRISGQHEEILVVRAGGIIERIDTLDLGFPIGLEANIAEFVGEASVELAAGDVVVLYTDGITEAEDEAGHFYGLDRLCEIVRHHRHEKANAIRQAVINDLRDHIRQQKVYDDITLLVMKQQ